MSVPENTQTQALAVVENNLPVVPFSAFGSISHFEDAQRMAMALCSSSIVPETYRGKERIGDCVIALEIANRIGASVLAVMQNLYVIYGRPAWSSQFLISCVNASRKFTPLRYRMTGTKGQDDWGCIAWAQDRSGEKLESPEVTIAMAKAEGWYQKNGSKWKTLPELMLRYRTATLFARLYAPELTMGIQSDDEIIDITPVVTEPAIRPPNFPEMRRLNPAQEEKKPAVVAATPPPAATQPAAPKSKAQPVKKAAPAAPVAPPPPTNVTPMPPPETVTPEAPEDGDLGPQTVAEPETTPEQAEAEPEAPEAPQPEATTAPAPAPEQPAAPTPGPFVPNPALSMALNNVFYLLHKHNKTEAQLVAVLKGNKAMKPEQAHVSELSEAKLENVSKAWASLLQQIQQNEPRR